MKIKYIEQWNIYQICMMYSEKMSDLVTEDENLEEDNTDSQEGDGYHGYGDPNVIQEHLIDLFTQYDAYYDNK